MRCLNLDVTETVYFKAFEGNTAALDDKRLEVLISIGDFGVGYYPLAHLKRLPADALKIDRTFVAGLAENIEGTAIVRKVIDLAHTLRMGVIAESVENEGQAPQLEEIGCDLTQGFYLSRPLPPGEIGRFLAA